MTTKAKDPAKAAKKMAAKAQGTVDLVLLCDESGSMGGKVEAVVSGVNEFLDSFKDKDCRVTVAMFDKHPGEARCRVKVKAKDIAKVKALTAKDYNPRGLTPLNDAILDVIGMLDDRKPERVFFCCLTDGMENASEADSETVAKAIRKRERKGWAFLYLGTGHDAHAAAAVTGMGAQGQSFNYNNSSAGTKKALRSASGLAQAYYASPDSASYMAKASALAASTGGKLDDDDDE